MTAPLPLAACSRHDRACAFCGDGTPRERRFGKAACGKCCAAFDEALGLSPTPARTELPGLRRAVRRELGAGPRDYPEPLWQRALDTRKVIA